MLSLQIGSLFPKLHTVTTVHSLKIEVITTNLPHCKLCFEGSFEFVVGYLVTAGRHAILVTFPMTGCVAVAEIRMSRCLVAGEFWRCSPTEQCSPYYSTSRLADWLLVLRALAWRPSSSSSAILCVVIIIALLNTTWSRAHQQHTTRERSVWISVDYRAYKVLQQHALVFGDSSFNIYFWVE